MHSYDYFRLTPFSGEDFSVLLSGTTHTVSVELEKQVVRFFDTYNTMMRQQTFKIVNKSDHVLTYMCMKNDCVYYGTYTFVSKSVLPTFHFLYLKCIFAAL